MESVKVRGKSWWDNNIMTEFWSRSLKYEETYPTQCNNIKEVELLLDDMSALVTLKDAILLLITKCQLECQHPVKILIM